MPDRGAVSFDDLDRQLNLLKTMDEVSDALDEFGENLSTYTGANVETKLSDDTSVDFLLGKLKGALTNIEGIREPYDKLTGPADTVGGIASHYKTVNDMAQAMAKAESLSGQEQAEVLGQIVDGMPGLASALTGLGSLSPAIGSFLVLYGKAIESAAVAIGIIEARNHEIVSLIRSRGELDVEAFLALREADEEVRDQARQALADQYDQVLDEYLRMRDAKDESNRKIATRYCVRRRAEEMHAALAAASRFPTRGTGTDIALSDHADIDESDLADIDEWVKAIEGDIVALLQNGDPERAQELTDARYEVLDAFLAPIKECIIERLTWMADTETAGAQKSAGTVIETVPARRWWWFLVGGLVLLMLVTGVVLLSGSDTGDQSLSEGENPITTEAPTTTAVATTTNIPIPEGERFTSANGWTIVFRGPDEVVAGENINLEWCAFDASGGPAEGEALGSVGPDGDYTAPEASHGSAPFVDGCASIELSNNVPEGGIIGIAGFFEDASDTPMDLLRTEVGSRQSPP